MIRISIDLLEDKQVIHVTGSQTGFSYGNCELNSTYDQLKEPMQRLGRIVIKNNLREKDDVENFQFLMNYIGDKIYQDIIHANAFCWDLYNPVTNFIGTEDLSLSFRLDRKYAALPIELMREKNSKSYVATQIPLFKTITTQGSPYRKSEAKLTLPEDEELQILLISSNTFLEKNKSKVKLGSSSSNEEYASFDLVDLRELDEGENNEIEAIQGIAESACKQGIKKVKCHEFRTDKYDCDTLLREISSNRYHIIHYNGHGYFDPSDPDKNYIFFWERKNKEGTVIGIDPNRLSIALRNTSNVKFFYLSCCSGAASAEGYERFDKMYLGFLDAIVFNGVPSALGMRWPISIHDCRNFSSMFYQSFLLEGKSLEASVANARLEALSYANKSVWCSPVLFKQSF